MAITIRPVPDKDLPRNCEIEAAAYAAFPLPEQFRPAPPPPKTSSDYESSNASTTNSTSPYAARLKYLIDNRDSDPSINYIGAYDDTTSQLIAFAKWHVYDNDEAAKAARRPMRSFSNAICPEACDELFGGLYDLKEKTVGGKRHLFLHMLHTDPAFQGRGAGGMLLQWGAKKADELEVPCYLEASKKGHGLYVKYGYKDVDVFKVDLRKYGGDEVYEQPVMIREARKVHD